LPALSEAAIMPMEDAVKIQTRMFDRPRTCFGLPKTKQGPDQIFAADSPAFFRGAPVLRCTKDKAVHAQAGKLCRPWWCRGMPERP